MIVEYKYCGYATSGRRTIIWGAVAFVEGGYTETYMFWGSPKAPIIKHYPSKYRKKKESLGWRIAEKRKYPGYTEIKDVDGAIEKFLPELKTQIGMHVLAKKLKNAGNR